MRTTKRKKEWLDDGAFWRELYPFLFPKKRIADADMQIEKALALTKPTGNSVLNLCCGCGRCGIALVVERHEIFDGWTRVRNEWLVIWNSSAMRFKFHHYSGQELRDRMEHAGFVGVTLHGNLDGDEYGANAERLIAIGRKPISKHREKGPNGASRNSE